MDSTDTDERIREVIVGLLGSPEGEGTGFGIRKLDTRRPTIHSSKRELRAELARVEAGIAGAKKILQTLAPADGGVAEHEQAIDVFVDTLDRNALRRSLKVSIVSSLDLVRFNNMRAGFSSACQVMLEDLVLLLERRRERIQWDEENFWMASHRPADPYARQIALRLAKLYARETGKPPTFGTAAYGAHASTNFGRALEDIFKILGIRTQVRHPAIWAISQLTERDFVGPNRHGSLRRGIEKAKEQ